MRFPPPPSPVPLPSGGFAILEILVATVLLAATFSMAAMLSMVSSRSMITSEGRGNQQSLIESDLAGIQELAETYTWCSGAGGFAASCTSKTPRTQDYYFPNTTDPNSSLITAFETACNNTTAPDTLNAALITAINNRPALSGISRTVASDDIPSHRLRITYTGTNANRLVVFTPTVAAWCP